MGTTALVHVANVRLGEFVPNKWWKSFHIPKSARRQFSNNIMDKAKCEYLRCAENVPMHFTNGDWNSVVFFFFFSFIVSFRIRSNSVVATWVELICVLCTLYNVHAITCGQISSVNYDLSVLGHRKTGQLDTFDINQFERKKYVYFRVWCYYFWYKIIRSTDDRWWKDLSRLHVFHVVVVCQSTEINNKLSNHKISNIPFLLSK